MKINKLIAAVLSVCMIIGAAGCASSGSAKDVSKIEDVMTKYVEGLQRFDCNSVLELTNWEEDDKEYTEAKELLNADFYKKEVGDQIFNIYTQIALTIKINYNKDDIKIDGDKATVKVRYELVGWGSIFADANESYSVVLEKIMTEKQLIPVNGKITLEKEKGEWKISKIPELREVYSFVFSLPYIDSTEPSASEPSGSETSEPSIKGTDFSDSYVRAIKAYQDVLAAHKEDITSVKQNFDVDPTGLYDIDGNGIPELYFFSDNGNKYSANLCIFTYNEYAGEAIQILSAEDVLSNGQSGGDYMVFATSNRLIICTTKAESTSYTVESVVYNFSWDVISEYSRTEITDYDPKTDKETSTFKYRLDGSDIGKDEYMAAIKDTVSKAKIVLGRKFNLSSNDPEYDLLKTDAVSLKSYDAMVEYLKTLA